jgi:hypothetical protein
MNVLVTVLYMAGVAATILAVACLTFVTVRRKEESAAESDQSGETWTADRLLHDLMWWH